MQYIKERETRRKEPRNLRDPKAKEGPGIKRQLLKEVFFERRGKFFGEFMRRKVGVNMLLEGFSKGGGGVRVSRNKGGANLK